MEKPYLPVNINRVRDFLWENRDEYFKLLDRLKTYTDRELVPPKSGSLVLGGRLLPGTMVLGGEDGVKSRKHQIETLLLDPTTPEPELLKLLLLPDLLPPDGLLDDRAIDILIKVGMSHLASIRVQTVLYGLLRDYPTQDRELLCKIYDFLYPNAQERRRRFELSIQEEDLLYAIQYRREMPK